MATLRWNHQGKLSEGYKETLGTVLVTSYKSMKMKVLVAQSCLTLCDPMDCSPPGSAVLGVLQARILEWVWSGLPFTSPGGLLD